MFDDQFKYLAFSASTLANVDNLRDEFGAMASTAPDHKDGEIIKTLLCGMDNSDTGKYRAATLGVDAVPIQLSDGRYCLGGHWSIDVINAFEADEIEGEEITVEQVKALTPQSEI